MNTNNNSKEVEIDRKDKKIVELVSKIEHLEKRNECLELAAAAAQTTTTTTTTTTPLNNNSDNTPADIVLPLPPPKQNKNFLGSGSSLELPPTNHKIEDILFSLKKGNIIAKFISKEGKFLVGKTK